MAWSTPSTRSTGDLITASIWNADVSANPIELRAGGIAIASQAANDIFYASSATQFARLATGAGFLRANSGAPSWGHVALITIQNITLNNNGVSSTISPNTGVGLVRLSLTGADERLSAITTTNYAAGDLLGIVNIETGKDMTLRHNDVAGGIVLQNGGGGSAAQYIYRYGGVLLMYDATSDRWRTLGQFTNA